MSRRKPLFPGRRFSIARFIAFLVAVALIAGGVWAWLVYTRTSSKKLPAPWFGGYADVTSTPSYTFESDVGDVYKNVVLGFITAPSGCTPSWGGYYSMDDAASQLDMDSRIARTARSGRTVTISFGGQQGHELASQCSTAQDLQSAYDAVISRYHVSSIDFDIEESNLDGYSDAATRRAQAVAALQSKAEQSGASLTVGLTLPVGTDGLTDAGKQTVESFLDAGVNLGSLNVMAMDFNVPSTTTDQATLIKQALNAVHNQYRSMLYSRGKLFNDTQIWEMMGVTVLIGQNDTDGEYLTLDDAQQVNTFALQANLGRVSMWSLNRDQQCGENASVTSTQTACSGMKQTSGEFATILGSGFHGTPGTIVNMNTTWERNGSDYPTWDAATTYAKGSKVVWDNKIYEALQQNTGVQPDSTANGVDSPWRLIGPTS
ncbi:MAG: chitinase [Bifidobacteriaceae bacterium]|nr:chitinase [Bifidobacteriaceae bacterium]